MGTFDVNLRTGTVLCSAAHLRMLGLEAPSDAEYAVDIWRSWIYPDDQARVQKAREQAIQNRSLYSVEYRVQRADNREVAWLAVYG